MTLRFRAPRSMLHGPFQSLQKSLKRVWLSWVYRVVCVIETCPSQSWMARVSMPSLASRHEAAAMEMGYVRVRQQADIRCANPHVP